MAAAADRRGRRLLPRRLRAGEATRRCGSARLFKALAAWPRPTRRARPGAWRARCATACVEAGFEVEKAPGVDGKREITRGALRAALRAAPRRGARRRVRPSGRAPTQRRSSSSAPAWPAAPLAWALAEQRLAQHRCSSATARSAREALGQRGRRVPRHRHAARRPARALPSRRRARGRARRAPRRVATAWRGRSTACCAWPSTARPTPACATCSTPLGLPADYVQAVGRAEAAALAGLPLRRAALVLSRRRLGRSGRARARLRRTRGRRRALARRHRGRRLRRDGDAWQLLDARGALIETTALPRARQRRGRAAPARRARLAAAARARPDQRRAARRGRARRAARPLAGFGYALPALDGRLWCGAQQRAGDKAPEVRSADHARNLAQLSRLLGQAVAATFDALTGRVGWRSSPTTGCR